jgi:hypothetical protein
MGSVLLTTVEVGLSNGRTSNFCGDRKMAMARRKKSERRLIRFLRFIFPPTIHENVCTECLRPRVEHPDRVPSARFANGNVEVFLYRKQSLRREYVARVGAWRSGADDFQLGQLIASQDLEDLLRSLTEAIEFVEGCEKVVEIDADGKMSFRQQVTIKKMEEYGARK